MSPDKFLKKNLDLKILSLMLSCLLWFFVHLTQNAEGIGRNEMHLTVPLTVENLSPKLQVLSAPSGITFAVSASGAGFPLKGMHKGTENLKASDFKAYVDLSGKNAGDYRNLPIHISSPVGYAATDISPPNAEVVVDEESDKTVPVTWVWSGEKETGNVVVTPREVAVKGPKNQVERVVAVQVEVPDPSLLGETENASPIPIDILSRPVAGVSVIPENVRILSNRSQNVRPIAVHPDIVGKMLHNAVLEAVSVKPAVVLAEITGGPQDLNHLDTEPIDITALEGTVVKKTHLIVPAGVRIHGDTEVTVMILIGK